MSNKETKHKSDRTKSVKRASEKDRIVAHSVLSSASDKAAVQVAGRIVLTLLIVSVISIAVAIRNCMLIPS